jgi:hypothetical protein
MLQGAPVLVIECEDNVEVYDANNLVARIDNILVTINEKNLSDLVWHDVAGTETRRSGKALPAARPYPYRGVQGKIRVIPA